MQRQQYDADHEAFRQSVRAFLRKEAVPYRDKWEQDGIVPRELFEMAGELGFLGMAVAERHGGGGVADFRFNAVLSEEVAAADVFSVGLGLTAHSDICLPYFLNLADEEQADLWMPDVAAGRKICAIAMTEPGAGSDLSGIATAGRKDGSDWVINGSKIFISNGINADLVVTAVKTDPSQRKGGMSLFVLERGMLGFERGRPLEKLGLRAQDTAELSFTDVRVPSRNLLGEEGKGFEYLVDHLPQERISVAVASVAAARNALAWTLEYVSQRNAFGKSIGSFQVTRFKLAEMDTEIDIAESYVDRCVLALNEGELTPVEAAKAKWWTTELQWRVVDACLQLYGGYGYTMEYPMARALTDARISRIYGGTTEIMKEIIGRALPVG